jgi:hypothetical protein
MQSEIPPFSERIKREFKWTFVVYLAEFLIIGLMAIGGYYWFAK